MPYFSSDPSSSSSSSTPLPASNALTPSSDATTKAALDPLLALPPPPPLPSAAAASTSGPSSANSSRPASLYNPRSASAAVPVGEVGGGGVGKYGSVGGSRARPLMRPVRGSGRAPSSSSFSTSANPNAALPRPPPHASSSSYSTALLSSSGREPWRFFSPNSIPNPALQTPLLPLASPRSQHRSSTRKTTDTSRPFSFAPSSSTQDDRDGDDTRGSEGGGGLGAWGVFALMQQQDNNDAGRGHRSSSLGFGGPSTNSESGFSLGRASTSSIGTVNTRRHRETTPSGTSSETSSLGGGSSVGRAGVGGWDILNGGARSSFTRGGDDSGGPMLVSSPPSMMHHPQQEEAGSLLSSSSLASQSSHLRHQSSSSTNGSYTQPFPPPSPSRPKPNQAGAPEPTFHEQIHHPVDHSIPEDDVEEEDDEELTTPKPSQINLPPVTGNLLGTPTRVGGGEGGKPMLSPRFVEQVRPSQARTSEERAGGGQGGSGGKERWWRRGGEGGGGKGGWVRWKLRGLERREVDVLKCAVAYFLASLFTFVPRLNALLPTPTNAHMVATISVYYNPAKSVGAMIEADLFCLFISLFTSLISLAAVGTLKAADEINSEMGDWLALFFWLGGAVSVLAWLKNWVGKGSFNTATSMGFLVMSIVIVKEGGLSKLLETLLVVVLGTTISNLVCFTLAPHSASSKLKSDINETLTSFSTLLSILSQTFLLDPFPSPLTQPQPNDANANGNGNANSNPSPKPQPSSPPPQQSLSSAVQAHEKSFKGLKTNLAEAKSEFLDPRIQRTGKAYDAVVDSLTRLAQHLTGMRSGTGLQVELMNAQREGRIVLDEFGQDEGDGDGGGEKDGLKSPSWSPVGVTKEKGREGGKARASSDYFGAVGGVGVGIGEAEEEEEEFDEEDRKLAEDANLFAEVREHVGPQLRALTIASTTTLLKIRSTFDPADRSSCDFDELREDLSAAHKAFQSASIGSILHLYGGGGDEKGEGMETAKGPKESVFLVFYFIFTLDEFARELLFLLDSMGEIEDQERLLDSQRSFLGWKWIWSLLTRRRKRVGATGGRPRERRTLRRRMSRLIPIDPSEFIPTFPRKSKDAPGTVTNPGRDNMTFKGRMLHTVWEMASRARKQDIKYAFKVGMATTLLAAPAFTETWKETFYEYRGEWALVSFFATMAPTLGQTNFLSLHRILGTMFGALAAATVYTLFPENPYVLPIFGFFFSIPCFYYIVNKPVYASSGRFVLLTYNLTALFSYNVRERDTPVWSIAWHRFLSVSIGVLYTLVVSRYWWPYEARRELRNALSDFLIDLSFLYTRLVATFSGARSSTDLSNFDARILVDGDEPDSERTNLLQAEFANSPLNPSVREFMSMELHLQLALIDLRGLLDAATKEPRLKGPFPRKLYNAILVSSQTMLDRFHSMRCVVNRDEWDAVVQRDFIRPVNRERRELVGNVLLYFSTLAAGFRLKTPLPPYLPPAEKARVRLLEKVESLTVVKRGKDGGARHLLFFSYVLAMAGIIKELEYLGGLQQDAFGVIGGTTAQFEALFTMEEEQREYEDEDQ